MEQRCAATNRYAREVYFEPRFGRLDSLPAHRLIPGGNALLKSSSRGRRERAHLPASNMNCTFSFFLVFHLLCLRANRNTREQHAEKRSCPFGQSVFSAICVCIFSTPQAHPTSQFFIQSLGMINQGSSACNRRQPNIG